VTKPAACGPIRDERPRPKQLALPPRFLEKNVWLALERGVELWSGDGKPIAVVNWPALPGEAGGLCLFEGPMARPGATSEKPVHRSGGNCVARVPTQPSGRSRTVGRLAVGPVCRRSIQNPCCGRRRYDWDWHAAALYGALKNISDRLPLNTPLFAIIPELEPAFLSAALLAAAGAGLELSGLALRSRHDPAQVLWHRPALFAHDNKESG